MFVRVIGRILIFPQFCRTVCAVGQVSANVTPFPNNLPSDEFVDFISGLHY